MNPAIHHEDAAGGGMNDADAALLARLGRTDEARADLLEAASLAANEREAVVLRRKAASLAE